MSAPDRAPSEVETAAAAMDGVYVALGTRAGMFGSVGLLDERSRTRLAEVALDAVRGWSRDDTVSLAEVLAWANARSSAGGAFCRLCDSPAWNTWPEVEHKPGCPLVRFGAGRADRTNP